jgi:hypothetical protein
MTVCQYCGCDALDSPCEHVVCVLFDGSDFADPICPFYSGVEYGGVDDEDFAPLYFALVQFAEQYDAGDEQWRAEARKRAKKIKDADARHLLQVTARLVDEPEDDWSNPQNACWCGLGDEFVALLDQTPGIEAERYTISTGLMSSSGTIYWTDGTAASDIRRRLRVSAAAVRRLLKRLAPPATGD